jgi:cysteine-S-conjugate beta-lyase
VNPLAELDLTQLRRRRSLKWRRYPPEVLPLWVAEMDVPLAPGIREALHDAIDLGDTGYQHPGRLAEAFAGFSAARFAWWPDPGTMVHTSDVGRGLYEILQVVTRPDDAVLLNTPAYPPFFKHIPHAGRRVRESPLARDANGRYRLDPDRLARDLAAPDVTAYLLVNPHNPTGLVLSAAELSVVAQLCDDHGVRVLADEIHGPLTYPGATFVPFLSRPEAQRGFAFVGASKAWNLPGLKASLIVPGAEAVADLRRVPEEAQYATGLFGILASEVAFRECGEWLDALLAGLDANRMLLGALLADHLPEVRYVPPDATYLAWLDCRDLGLDTEPGEFFLRHAAVAVNAGPTFGTAGDGFVRLNFATSPRILTTGVERMAAAVTRLRAAPSTRR